MHTQEIVSRVAMSLVAFGALWAQEGPPPAVSYASADALNSILGQLHQTSQNIQDDLGRLRIEKWKTDASSKQQAMANVESIRRNLQSALPEVMDQLARSPEDIGASFRLYRNLDALYDVFGSVVELTGAFGSKEEFQALANDGKGLEGVRREFGERMQNLATSKENELAHLRSQVKALQAAPPTPPKKIVVDDTAPPAKPAKKKPARPTSTPAGSTTTTPKPSGSPPGS